MKRIFIIVLILTTAVALYAQYREGGATPNIQNNFLQPRGLFGLINPDNLNMSQSYTMSFMSTSSGSVMQNMYLNNMRYRISGNMMLNLQLGFMNQPYSSFSDNGFDMSQGANFLGSATLLYRPTDNMLISIGYSNLPYYQNSPLYDAYYPYNPYRLFDEPVLFRTKEYSPGYDR